MSTLNAEGETQGAELADVISQVRAELEKAQTRGRESDLRFRVEKVNLEFEVQVRRETGGKGGLRIGVVTADVGRTTGNDRTHRISVELQPRNRDGGGTVDVGGPDRAAGPVDSGGQDDAGGTEEEGGPDDAGGPEGEGGPADAGGETADAPREDG
ncbi:trypco2 family protein [Streptomyces agglomeratus]|uniref:trypco2 family protein n=1 Tax=Streptomyces agglomeratus TaxID=285458 RepID=UPI00159F1032|nr:trypco2 family protein [Streptomyces agglomeratus]